eukprot:10973449-Karenia_brevis.AAC.1
MIVPSPSSSRRSPQSPSKMSSLRWLLAPSRSTLLKTSRPTPAGIHPPATRVSLCCRAKPLAGPSCSQDALAAAEAWSSCCAVRLAISGAVVRNCAMPTRQNNWEA